MPVFFVCAGLLGLLVVVLTVNVGIMRGRKLDIDNAYFQKVAEKLGRRRGSHGFCIGPVARRPWLLLAACAVHGRDMMTEMHGICAWRGGGHSAW